MGGKLVYFELPAENADRAQKFYEDLFGWKFQSGEGPFDYRMLEGDVQPGGAVYPAQAGERGPIVYFDTDDIEATIMRTRELGGEADDKQPIPGIGWFARGKDPEGNPISFYQPDESVPHAHG
jgi:predicted enzyme related to lactoylglutathione lyase